MESAKDKLKQEAHLLIFPFPAQGHINTMLRLADALSFAGGLRISFLNTDHNHRLLSFFSPSQYSRFSLRPKFRFLSIPDGLPDDKPRTVNQVIELVISLRTSMDSFRELLLASGERDPDGWPPVTCFIVDGAMPFFMDTAQALGIPAIVFRTISASSLWVYLHIPQMIEAGELPFSGWKCSTQDARIFQHAMTDPRFNFPTPPTGKYYLVDATYPLQRGYMKPYPDTRYHLAYFIRGSQPVRGHKEVFNKRHSLLRSIIEHAFGVWKKK